MRIMTKWLRYNCCVSPFSDKCVTTKDFWFSYFWFTRLYFHVFLATINELPVVVPRSHLSGTLWCAEEMMQGQVGSYFLYMESPSIRFIVLCRISEIKLWAAVKTKSGKQIYIYSWNARQSLGNDAFTRCHWYSTSDVIPLILYTCFNFLWVGFIPKGVPVPGSLWLLKY